MSLGITIFMGNQLRLHKWLHIWYGSCRTSSMICHTLRRPTSPYSPNTTPSWWSICVIGETTSTTAAELNCQVVSKSLLLNQDNDGTMVRCDVIMSSVVPDPSFHEPTHIFWSEHINDIDLSPKLYSIFTPYFRHIPSSFGYARVVLSMLSSCGVSAYIVQMCICSLELIIFRKFDLSGQGFVSGVQLRACMVQWDDLHHPVYQVPEPHHIFPTSWLLCV